jgi:hypothetical protein
VQRSRVEGALGPELPQQRGRLVEGLVGQLEGAPVHGEEVPGAQIEEGLDGVLGVHVLGLHEPPGLVGADGQHRDVDRADPLADELEAGEVGRVPRVVGPQPAGLVDKAAPQGLVRIG